MGNTQPGIKTGRKVVQQKLEKAEKTNILSLTEHKLEEVPEKVFAIKGLKTLDVSRNNLASLGNIDAFPDLKILQCDDNKLLPGSLKLVSKLSKLQSLRAGGNLLGQASTEAPLPELPSSLKQLVLDRNLFSSVPPTIVSPSLSKLEKLDLSSNRLASVPPGISNLAQLEELKLDNNMIVSLPDSMGKLRKLKSLSLKENAISVPSTIFSARNPQPLPAALLADTPLIDLNLHGNPLTSTELNQFEGYPKFLERRAKIKTTALYGGALMSSDVCGLE